MAAHQVLESVTEDAYKYKYKADCQTLERGSLIRSSSRSIVSTTSAPSSTASTSSRTRSVPTTPRIYPSEDDEEDDRDLRIVLVGEECSSDQELLSTARDLSVAEVVLSEDGLDCIQAASECETLFVLKQFEGDRYHKLHRAEARIIGPPVILACRRNKQVLPYSSRPLFCMSMQRVVVCFTGFKGRDRIGHLVDLVHHMGGSVRRDMTPKVTHLIANCTGGEKYKFAMTMGMPIMSGRWVEQLWEERYNLDITADCEAMMDYKVKPFFDCCVSFLGFSQAEQKHMEELTVQNGGSHTTVGSSDATHLVVDEVTVKELPASLTLPSYIVRGEWFWGCIQMSACAEESLYLFHMPSSAGRSVSSSSLRPRSRKRKRLKQLAVEGELGSPYTIKRRSSEMSAISLSPNSFLDASRTPDKSAVSQSSLENTENKPVVSSNKASKRMHVVAELLQTETNYTDILHTILHTFKEQIDKPDQYNGPLLAPQDTKIIFGNIPPIYDVHSQMKEDLSHLLEHWTEDTSSVGAVILKHADGFMKAYPNFVNFFENTKETIIRCDQHNPRFHAFLKVCLSKPECGRQTLQELLIRPVQRLPSIILLLGDILKSTPNSHSDKEKLEKAIESLKNVLTHINEDKRKTEGQMVMFDIVNDIDNCPATLLSSHRSFLHRIDVVELTDTLGHRGDPMSLFVFTDSIEVCKRRTKALATPKTLTPHKTPQKTPHKTFKHLELLPIPSVKRVLDFAETDDCVCAFGLIYRNKDQSSEKLLSFMLDSADMRKEEMLTMLCKTIANALCRTDFETVMAEVCGDEFHVNTRDLVRRTLTSKISKRVSRAFSINRTPGKLKRAVSHVFSPFMRDGPGDLSNARRLGASTFDLTEECTSGMSHLEDSDCISLGAFSLQEESSPVQFLTPKSVKTPKGKGVFNFKSNTIGSHSASKYLK